MRTTTPENVKPSRINRKRKRRWKIGTALSQLTQPKIRLGSKALTDCRPVAHNLATAPHWAVGRENLFSKGVKPPQPYVAFLCASYYAAFCRLSLWRFVWAAFELAGFLYPVFSPHSNRRPSREKLDRRIISLSKGVNA